MTSSEPKMRLWIFCPQMTPHDIPKMSQIGVKRDSSSKYSDSPKIDTFCVCSKLQKCVNLWRGNFWRYFPKNFWSKIDILKFREILENLSIFGVSIFGEGLYISGTGQGSTYFWSVPSSPTGFILSSWFSRDFFSFLSSVISCSIILIRSSAAHKLFICCKY